MKKLIVSVLLMFFMAGACLAETVVFNTKTHKYHQPGCHHAIKCTANCIKIEKAQAKIRGGVPCKVCGG